MNKRLIALGVSYVVAGLLFILAFNQIVPDAIARQAITFCGAGLILAFVAWRFLSDREPGPFSRSFPLMASWAIGGAAILYGLVRVTPGPEAQAFVGFAGAGVLVALLGWWFLSDLGLGGLRSAAGFGASETAQERDTRWTRDTVLIFCYVGIVGILLLAIRSVVPVGQVEGMFRVLGVGILIGCGSLLTGALLGFLFGIPRAQATPDVQPPAQNPQTSPAGTGPAPLAANARGSIRPFQVNTNLEQISDWLTKIIVGLGLINLARIPDDLDRLANYFSSGFGNLEGREAITLTLIVAFLVSGFLLGYLLTRLFLTGAFTRAESPTEELRNIVEGARNRFPGSAVTPTIGTGGPGGGGPAPIAPPGPAIPGPPSVSAPSDTTPPSGQAPAASTPSATTPSPAAPVVPKPGPAGDMPRRSDTIDPAQIAGAVRASEIANQVSRSEIHSQVMALANEYSVKRGALPFSAYRTQLLDDVVARMRVLSGAAYWMLPDLVRGYSPGERLAAIAFLQMRPDPAFAGWLEERCGKERPFLQYHAAIALRNAADQLPEEFHSELRSAIVRARQKTKDEDALRILAQAEAIIDQS